MISQELLRQNPSARYNLIIIDVQPEYLEQPGKNIEGINAQFLKNFISFLNQNYHKYRQIYYLYNGKETLDMISESQLKFWLREIDIQEEVISKMSFYDKGYAFFSACIDDQTEQGQIVRLVRYMYQNDILDSRQLPASFWEKWKDQDIRQTLYHDPLYIPELMDYLDKHLKGTIDIIGGSKEACLYEVEIALLALKRRYRKHQKLIY